jgi:hypothetical protein
MSLKYHADILSCQPPKLLLMKKIRLSFAFACLLTCFSKAQNNVGIGVAAPSEALSIDRGLNIDHNNQNPGNSLMNAIRFGNAADNTQLVGISSNRTGATPYSLDFYTANQRRMIITSAGFVGIGMTPLNHYFEVNGTAKANTLRSGGSIFADGGSVQASQSVIAGTSISAGTSITAGTNLIATQHVMASNGDVIAYNGDIITNTGHIIAGGRFIGDGKGVVMSNTNNRQKIAHLTATMTATMNPGTTLTAVLNIGSQGFTAVSAAYVGNVLVENGEYYKVMLSIENATTSNVTIRLFNPTASQISFTNAQWRIVVIGDY